MKRSLIFVALLVGLALTASTAFAVTNLTREFSYDQQRVSTASRGGFTEVSVKGAAHDLVPGRPDLPWIGEAIDIPGSHRVVAVEVVSFETEPLAEGVRIPSSPKVVAGVAALERTPEDPDYYARSGFQPEELVALGMQGWQQGRNVAWLRVAPVRWDAASGRLERVSRVRVRVTLDGEIKPALPRLRSVPEWERSAVAPRMNAAPEAAVERRVGPQPFAATQIPSLLGSPVAYVIITDDAMADEFQRLAEWKTQSGVPAVVRTLSFIRQQYRGGSDDAERIREFIQDAYSRWGTRWVLLAGDTEVLPTRFIRTTFYGGENIACDMYFSCLDGNWNGDGDALFGEGYKNSSTPGDSADFLPEVWVGRAPVVDVAQASVFIDKTLQYAKQPVGDYENNVLFFAEVLFPQNWTPGDPVDFDGAEMSEQVLPMLQTNPALRYSRLYENHLDPGYEPGAHVETRQAVVDSMNSGTFNLAVHFGHGYRNVMSVGDANLTNDDALALTNGNRLFHLYANNCTSNAIDFPCIGEAFLHNPNGGAVTNTGSSRFDFPLAGRSFTEEFFRLVYEDSVTAVGEAQALQKVPFAWLSGSDGVNRWTTTTLLLLGDPQLNILTGRPRTLSVVHPASVSIGDTALAVSVSIGGVPLLGARVTAYRPGDEYASLLTNGAGNVVLPFHADEAGDFTLTVTAFDCRPYQALVPVTAAAVPLLADGAVLVDDDNLGGTSGDGDGTIDAGETVDLRIPVTNKGGALANDVKGLLSTTDPLVSITSASVSYGGIAPSASSNPLVGFRVSVPFTVPDQHEIAFQLRLLDTAGHTAIEKVQVTVHAPELLHVRHQINCGGLSKDCLNADETVTYRIHIRNAGTGDAAQLTAKLRNYDGLATVFDSVGTLADLDPGEDVLSDPFVFYVSDLDAKLEVRVSDQYGLRLVQKLDLVTPDPPTDVAGVGAGSSIDLSWTKSMASDLQGYRVYRAESESGPFRRSTDLATGRTAYYRDDGLESLTRYYYLVTAVDSSGNESAVSAVASASTNPPLGTLFPSPTGQPTISSVAVDHLYPDYPMDIVAGSGVLYVLHPDGSAALDADGSGATHADFTTEAGYFAAGPSIADLEGDGVREIIAPTLDDGKVFVFDQAGQVKSGWPATLEQGGWSSAAIGDLDNDGSQEIVLSTNGTKLYAFRANGTEWMDGDANPVTIGVFKTFGVPYNFGTPALADIDGNNELDIVFAGFDKKLYAWRPNGANLPGFPITLSGPVTASVAIGHLDGPSDTQLDIVVSVGSLNLGPDSVYAFRANGSRRAGWPIAVPTTHNNRTPSPALGDIDGDGFVDVVIAGTDGGLYVFNRNGGVVTPFSGLRYSAFVVGSSESSPIVGDINGDGTNDILMGDENGLLSAFSGDGSPLPGFPIQLSAEIKGTPAICDCDGDGMTEIVALGWDTNVYMWEYNFPYSPNGSPPWPQFHHDAQRTGNLTHRVLVDVPGPVEVPFATIELGRPWPNPLRGGVARMNFGIPADRAGASLDLAIYDLAGRRVRMLEQGVAQSGRHSVEWDLRGDSGQPVRSGVYFLRMAVGAEAFAHKVVVLDR